MCGVVVLPEEFEKLLVADLLGVKDDPHHLSVPCQPCGESRPCSAYHGAAPHRGFLLPNPLPPRDGVGGDTVGG